MNQFDNNRVRSLSLSFEIFGEQKCIYVCWRQTNNIRCCICQQRNCIQHIPWSNFGRRWSGGEDDDGAIDSPIYFGNENMLFIVNYTIHCCSEMQNIFTDSTDRPNTSIRTNIFFHWFVRSFHSDRLLRSCFIHFSTSEWCFPNNSIYEIREWNGIGVFGVRVCENVYAVEEWTNKWQEKYVYTRSL